MSEHSSGNQQKKRIVIIGGGVAGLAAAYRLVEAIETGGAPVELCVYEARERVGGSVVTQRKDDFLIEGGPDSFITQKPWALQLCRRLGIEDQLIQTNPDYRRTYVVRDGKMYPIPEGFLLLAPTRIWPFVFSRLFSWPGKIRMGMDLFLPAKDHGQDGDESLGGFVRRRFGREALERIAQPLVGGIYTADPDKLSLRTTMPRFLEMEVNHRSLIKAMRKGITARKRQKLDSGARYSMFVSLARGMDTLVEAITSRLPTGSIKTNCPLKSIARRENAWHLNFGNGRSETADGVILATPAHIAGEVTRSLDSELSNDLSAIPYASSATLTMAIRREQVDHALDGFGFVVPVVEGHALIAATFSSVKFAGRAPHGWLLLRAFLGGALQPEVYDMSDDQLREVVIRDLRKLIGLKGEPVFSDLYRWPLSMPQYPVGHLHHVADIHDKLSHWPGLTVAGNGYTGVGIPDCVNSGEQAAEALLKSLVGNEVFLPFKNLQPLK